MSGERDIGDALVRRGEMSLNDGRSIETHPRSSTPDASARATTTTVLLRRCRCRVARQN